MFRISKCKYWFVSPSNSSLTLHCGFNRFYTQLILSSSSLNVWQHLNSTTFIFDSKNFRLCFGFTHRNTQTQILLKSFYNFLLNKWFRSDKMSCNSCSKSYGFFCKEVTWNRLKIINSTIAIFSDDAISLSFYFHKKTGCPSCGFSFCTKCLKKSLALPKFNGTEKKVCLICYDKHTKSKQSTSGEPMEMYCLQWWMSTKMLEII